MVNILNKRTVLKINDETQLKCNSFPHKDVYAFIIEIDYQFNVNRGEKRRRNKEHGAKAWLEKNKQMMDE